MRSQLRLFKASKAGIVLTTILSVQSEAEQFLEGEMRAFLSNATNNSCSYGVCAYMTLSSGTEDYFLGTYYFNRGSYHNPLAELSHLAHDKGGWTFSAYRRHDTGDLLVWPRGDFEVTWRCGEPRAGNPKDCVTFSYALVYEW